MDKALKKEMSDAVIGVGSSNMRSLPIYIATEADESLSELLGKETSYSTSDFFFPVGQFGGFFILDEDICYYVNGLSCSCPYTEETLRMCIDLCK